MMTTNQSPAEAEQPRSAPAVPGRRRLHLPRRPRAPQRAWGVGQYWEPNVWMLHSLGSAW